MSAKIYWFSGTGNSLAVARTLAESLPSAELIPMARVLSNPASVPAPGPSDVIGLVYPVYAFGPPALVLRFLRRLKLSADSYVFSVCTCASTAGDALGFVRGALQKQGADVSAAWVVKQPENYPPFGSAPELDKQEEIQSAADDKVVRIAEELASRPRGVFEQAGALVRLAGRLVYPAFCAFERRAADRFFKADSRCNGCGICADICPVQNITIENGRPVWLGHCEQCFACFHWCPSRAVQYGRSARLRRYHHPRASLSDFRKNASDLEFDLLTQDSDSRES